MTRRETTHHPRRRWRDHLSGTLAALSILALTMAVVVGPGTSVGHRLSERIEAWVAHIAPVDDETLDLASVDLPRPVGADQPGSAVMATQALGEEVKLDH
ncbi:hypothetical protein [Halotalea alkalilenta]|uniref:hypothetical protein n=1 Tax=Halotalea alkalilenta TaxID=376489 RepID=UPI0007D04128|nr:hypothetical protein [Halotalea alkalilenta]